MKKYLLMFSLLAITILMAACRHTRHAASTSKPSDALPRSMDSLIPSLRVAPLTFSLADATHTTMAFQLRNIGHQTGNAESLWFEILVTGQQTSHLDVGISNGLFEDKWFALPPGDSIERNLNSLGPVLFDQVGTYQLLPKLNGKSGEMVTVTVTN